MNGAKIALFDEAIKECLENGQRMFIDIKEKDLAIVQIIVNAFNSNPELFRKAVVSSFNPLVIYMVSLIIIKFANNNNNSQKSIILQSRYKKTNENLILHIE